MLGQKAHKALAQSMPISIAKFPLFKITATGNDFILVDLLTQKTTQWTKDFKGKSRSALVKHWCRRQDGIGADGMVFIEKDKDQDFKWEFYNSDGGKAEMCGNAARAVSLYVSQKLKRPKLKFRTAVGTIDASIKSAKSIEVRLPAIKQNLWNQTLDFKGSKTSYEFIRAGVPHVVVQVPNLKDLTALKELALHIKRQPAYAEHGTNVTFVHPLSTFKIESTTFERGVEDFTLSCGTGAIAAAHSILRGEEGRTVEVQVPGGTLFVIWKQGQPYLKGPAKIVAEIHVCL